MPNPNFAMPPSTNATRQNPPAAPNIITSFPQESHKARALLRWRRVRVQRVGDLQAVVVVTVLGRPPLVLRDLAEFRAVRPRRRGYVPPTSPRARTGTLDPGMVIAIAAGRGLPGRVGSVLIWSCTRFFAFGDYCRRLGRSRALLASVPMTRLV